MREREKEKRRERREFRCRQKIDKVLGTTALSIDLLITGYILPITKREREWVLGGGGGGV